MPGRGQGGLQHSVTATDNPLQDGAGATIWRVCWKVNDDLLDRLTAAAASFAEVNPPLARECVPRVSTEYGMELFRVREAGE